MKHKLLFQLVLVFLANVSNAQEQIKGTSAVRDFKMQIAYKPGQPPNLYADLNFSDDNGNGILEAEEKALLKITLTNKGSGRAQGLKIKLAEILSNDQSLLVDGEKEIQILNPYKSVDLVFLFSAGINTITAKHKFKITVSEHFGYDMDPAYLEFQTYEYQAPKLAFAGLEIFDSGEGTVPLIKDGTIQPGEMVKAKIMVQNTGQKEAKNVSYKVTSGDPNVYLTQADGKLDDIKIGEVKEFWITISPNKRMESKNELPVFLSLSLDKAKGNLENFPLPLALNKKPPESNILQISADINSLLANLPVFVIDSNRFTANFGKIVDIREVTPSNTKRADAVAVIFGIEKYINGMPEAPYAENDARIIKEYFKNRLGIDKIVLYTSEKAKGLIFDDVFNPLDGELQRAVVKGVTDVFVFYSGHGIPSKDGNQVYLFPSDGKITRLDIQGYNLNRLYRSLDSLGARNVTVFMDACFTGASRSSEKKSPENLVAMKGIRVEPKLYQPWDNNPNFSVFSSSGSGETSLSFDASQTGLFTYFLCSGLLGNADENHDRKITQGELFQYVREEVMHASTKISGMQTPEFHGNSDLVLVEF
jgi:hypothetical protein